MVNESEQLTNNLKLEKVMRESMNVWNENKLDEGDVITLLAHLQHYVTMKRGIH